VNSLGIFVRFDDHKKLTAEVLGISLKTLYNRLAEYAGTDESAASR
jgi:DNA-binding NtrC family response regulator